MTRLFSLAFVLGVISSAGAGECLDGPIDHWQRAGQPTCVHRFAIPSKMPRYGGGMVGGGAVLLGGEPCVDEGTWGWDYAGLLPKRVWLGWSHKHYQAGGGKYDTDRRPRH